MRHPFDKTWWISEGQFMGGQYPGTPNPNEQKGMLDGLLDLGIDTIVNLQHADETNDHGQAFSDYTALLFDLARERGVTVDFKRFPVTDQRVPSPQLMRQILDHIDSALRDGRKVYVHCWGGNGRTGTVAGCWLVRHGHSADEAFAAMKAGRRGRKFRFEAPENEKQRQFVRNWYRNDLGRPQAEEVGDAPADRQMASEVAGSGLAAAQDRAIAALLGLAVGDAVGTTVEFQSPGSFSPVSDMVGGGPFNLQAGQWTDDTSMALCLADSLVESRGFDPSDQAERYCRWWQEGYLSPTGKCFDIGNTTRTALAKHRNEGKAYCGSTAPKSAGNGALMRLAPVAVAYANRPATAIVLAGESSRTTHGATESIDACRYFAGILCGLITGAGKNDVLASMYSPVPGLWDVESLAPGIQTIAAGSFKEKSPPVIRGAGYVVACLEAALWAFHTTDSFEDAILAAVNLGDDADTTAAVCGQVAGACYGRSGIPQGWLGRLAMRSEIQSMAQALVGFWLP